MIVILESAVLLAVLIWPYLFFEPVTQFRQAKIYLCDPFYAAFFVYVFYKLAAEASKRTVAKGSWRWFVLYLLVCLAQLLRGIFQYGHSAIGESRIYLLPVLFYFTLVLASPSEMSLKSMATRVLCAVLTMIPLNGLLYYFEYREQEVDGRFRFLWATEALPVSLSATALVVYNSVSDSVTTKRRQFFLAAYLLAIVALAQVRSVWVATGAILILLLLFPKTRVSALTLGGGAAACLLIYLLVAGGDLRDKIQDDFDRSSIFLWDFNEDANATWRLRGWEQEIEEFEKSPILGGGFGRYSWWYDGHEWQRVAVHNGIIMALSKCGLVGVSFLVLGLITWFRETWNWSKATAVPRRRGWLWACQAGVLAHLVYALFYDFTLYLWLLIGAGTLVGYAVAAEAPEEAPAGETNEPLSVIHTP